MKKFFILCLCTVICGCGTVANLTSPVDYMGPRTMTSFSMSYYGGVEIDLTYTVLSGFILLPLTIVDIPLSIVADTLTLPVVSIIKNRERAKWQEITLMAKQGQSNRIQKYRNLILNSINLYNIHYQNKQNYPYEYYIFSSSRYKKILS